MRRWLLVVALVAAGRGMAVGAERWTVARSPHFEVATDAGPALAKDAARRLERLRDVIRRLLPTPEEAEDADGSVIRVLLPHDRASFAALVPRGRSRVDDVAGFFETGTDGPLVVVCAPSASDPPASEDAGRFSTLDHEYVHVHLNLSLPAQPVWVAEGLADALSGGDLEGEEAHLAAVPRPAGAAPPLRIPLAELLALDWDSPTYRGRSSTDAFYAESLALVRWVLARHGLAALRLFLDAVASGQGVREAFAARFGEPESVEPQLVDPPAGPLLHVSTAGPIDPPLVVSVPSEADVEYRLGDVLLHGGHRQAAQRRFEAALGKDASHAPARAGLAQALLQSGRWADARRELQLALETRPDDPGALLRYARLLLAEGRDREEGLSAETDAAAVQALERAVALAPDLADAAELLAHESPKPLAQRIALVRRSFARDPGRPELGLTLSWLYLRRGDVESAHAVLRRSREAARDDAYRFLCDHQLSQLREYARGTAEVRGRLVRLECRGDGSLRFTLATADGGELPLEASSSRSVFVTSRSGLDEIELVCGPQSVPIRARYLPPADADHAGTLLNLEPSGEAGRRSPTMASASPRR
jgi:tetratricopeptide (TPR) repeat protein